MNQKTLETHREAFAELVNSPAFKLVRDEFFDSLSLAPLNQDMESLAKNYIREAAIRDVFRRFDFCASGGSPELDFVEQTQLLPEADMDDGALELLD